MRSWSFICSVIAHALLLLLIFGLSAWIKPQKEPELIPLDLELVEEAAASGPVAPPIRDVQEEKKEPDPPPPPKEKEPDPPPPPKEKEPEPPPPPKEKEPEPPKPVDVKKPDQPKPVDVKKPDQPKEKPLSRAEQMQKRMEEARKTTSHTVTPSKQPQTPKTDNSEAIKRTLDKFANSSKGVSIPNVGSVAGVSAAQMSNYNRYLAQCVRPMLDKLWQAHGPNALNGNASDVVITFHVAPNGAVKSCIVSTASNSGQMNAAAQALIRELTQKGLPPFSTVGLSTERNASLPIQFNLAYTN